jgi:hypothetical protein
VFHQLKNTFMKKLLLIILLGLTSKITFSQWTNLNALSLPGNNGYDYSMMAVSNTGKNIAAYCIKYEFGSPTPVTHKYVISKDFGVTWTEQTAPGQVPGQMFWVSDVLFVKETLSDTLKKSTDFGATFSYQGTKRLSLGSKIAVINPSKWLFQQNVSGSYKLFVSTDQGTTWTEQTSLTVLTAPNFSSFVVLSNGTIVSVGATGAKVVYSSDDGNTWLEGTLPEIIGAYEHRINLTPNGELLMFVGNPFEPKIIKSTDNGVTWQNVSTNMPNTATALLYQGNDIICLCKDASTHKSTDNGATFTQISAPNELYTSGIFGSKTLEKSTDNLFTCGSNKIYRYGPSSQTGLLTNKKEELTFTLFPNPASSFVQLSSTSDIVIQSIVLMNANGQKIKEVNPGAIVDISGIPAGMYFVQVLSNNGLSTQRFIKQ